MVWSRGSRLAEHPAFAPDEIRPPPSAPDRHLDHPVRPRRAVGRQAGDRVHPAGVVRRCHRSRPGCAGPRAGVRRRADRRVAGRSVCGAAGHDGGAVRASSTCRCSRSQILCLTYYSVSFIDMLGRPFRDLRRLTIPGVATAADGLVALGCGTAQQWFDLCAMTGHHEWIDEESPLSITEQANIHAGHLRVGAREHASTRSSTCRPRSASRNAPVGNGANDHLDRPVRRARRVRHQSARRVHATRTALPRHAVARACTASLRRDSASTPTTTERHNGIARHRDGDAGELPFEGLRVLDMTSFWAGPSCTHVLAKLGAEVIHVESTARPDGTRLIAGVPITEDQWWERSPIFSGLNTNKKSVTLDIRNPTRRRTAPRARRDVRRHRRELHAAGARPDRARLRRRARGCVPTRSWCACPASGSTVRGGTSRRSPTSSRTPPGSPG